MHAKEIVPSSGLWEHGRHGNSGPAQGDVAAKRFTKQAPAKCFDGIQLLGCPGCDWPVSYALLRRHPPVGRQKRASPAPRPAFATRCGPWLHLPATRETRTARGRCPVANGPAAAPTRRRAIADSFARDWSSTAQLGNKACRCVEVPGTSRTIATGRRDPGLPALCPPIPAARMKKRPCPRRNLQKPAWRPSHCGSFYITDPKRQGVRSGLATRHTHSCRVDFSENRPASECMNRAGKADPGAYGHLYR